MDDETLKSQRKTGLIVSCIVVFSSFIYGFIIYLLKIMSEMNLRMYDVNTTTVSDFSI